MSYDPNEMMLDLFRAEVESHSDSLMSSLLKLEHEPANANLLAGMMRAAHSIKGAARIVGVDPAVELAHVMEDCFVLAQRGELTLEPVGIDILLKSVDLLVQVSEATKNPNIEWNSFRPAIESTVTLLRSVLHGQPIVADAIPSLPSPPQSPLQTASKAAPIQVKAVPMTSPVECRPALATPANSIHMPENLNRNNAEPIRLKLLSALDSQANDNQVIIDLSLTRELDAVGLALMHSATKFAASKNRHLRFENATPALARVLQAIGIGPIGSISGTGNEGNADGN